MAYHLYVYIYFQKQHEKDSIGVGTLANMLSHTYLLGLPSPVSEIPRNLEVVLGERGSIGGKEHSEDVV